MSFARFDQLVEQQTGLSAECLGASTIERAARARVRACGLKNIDGYWNLVARSPEELQTLVEAVVIPETWFFRTPQAFRAMARLAREWVAANPGGVLRLLSLPCSTGEEPYTMAMALLEEGVPANRFTIDAIDISSRALAIAECGTYGSYSFRAADLAFRERHFERAEQKWRIAEMVRGTVRFMQGNLLDPDFVAGRGPYEMVLCRNLLIYFNAGTQSRAIAVLKRLLTPAGILFVGHSESGVLQGHGFAPAKIPMAFAFRNGGVPQQAKAKPIAPRPAPRPLAAVARSVPPARPFASPPKRQAEPTNSAPDLGELHRMADRGQLAEAARGCKQHIEAHGASPEALLLLGLIKDAAGDASAAALCYRKTLYLQPDHREALSHLSLLLKRQGDASGAKVLNDRMRRLGTREAR